MIPGKRGSAMVEAAIVIPVVILTVILLIEVMKGLYTMVEVSAAKHKKENEKYGVTSELGESMRRFDFLQAILDQANE